MSRTVRGTTAATCSTRRGSAASSAGAQRSPSRRGCRPRSNGTGRIRSGGAPSWSGARSRRRRGAARGRSRAAAASEAERLSHEDEGDPPGPLALVDHDLVQAGAAAAALPDPGILEGHGDLVQSAKAVLQGGDELVDPGHPDHARRSEYVESLPTAASIGADDPTVLGDRLDAAEEVVRLGRKPRPQTGTPLRVILGQPLGVEVAVGRIRPLQVVDQSDLLE